MRTHERIRILFIILLMVRFLGTGAWGAETSKGSESREDAVSYVVDKCGRYDVVLLGTRHKRPEVLRFVSGLLRELEDVYVELEKETSRRWLQWLAL